VAVLVSRAEVKQLSNKQRDMQGRNYEWKCNLEICHKGRILSLSWRFKWKGQYFNILFGSSDMLLNVRTSVRCILN